MGLFDKLFGDDKKAAAFMNFLKEVSEEKEKEKAKKKAEQPAAPKPEPKPEPAEELAPAGTYWGELKPAEECQYNFKGSWKQYFDKVFREEFAEYRITCEDIDSKTQVYTFYDGSRTALVVELLPKSSSRTKLRRDTQRAGIPYLRYYHNVEGWWNVRAYVVERTKTALGI